MQSSFKSAYCLKNEYNIQIKEQKRGRVGENFVASSLFILHGMFVIFLVGEIYSLKIYSELEEENWVTFRLDKESFLNIYALCVATSSKSRTMLDSFDSILQAGVLGNFDAFIFC